MQSVESASDRSIWQEACLAWMHESREVNCGQRARFKTLYFYKFIVNKRAGKHQSQHHMSQKILTWSSCGSHWEGEESVLQPKGCFSMTVTMHRQHARVKRVNVTVSWWVSIKMFHAHFVSANLKKTSRGKIWKFIWCLWEVKKLVSNGNSQLENWLIIRTDTSTSTSPETNVVLCGLKRSHRHT